MTGPTLPRRCGDILTLAWLLVAMTAALVTGNSTSTLDTSYDTNTTSTITSVTTATVITERVKSATPLDTPNDSSESSITTDNPKTDGSGKETFLLTVVIGLASGLGGALFLAVVLAVVVLWKHRLFKERKSCKYQCSGRQTGHNNSNRSAVDLVHSYENVTSSPVSAIVRMEAEVQRGDVQARPSSDVPEHNSFHEYINVPSLPPYDNDRRGQYESANTPDSSETRLYTNLKQTACP